MNSCNDAVLASILNIFKNILLIIQILGPILCIVGLIVLFVKMINNPDEKKGFNQIRNCVLALVLTFFVPIIVNAVVKIVDEDSNFRACWEASDKIKKGEDTEYIDSNDKKKSPIINDSKDYKNS